MKEWKKILAATLALVMLGCTLPTESIYVQAAETSTVANAELEDDLINYATIESADVSIPGTQNIVVGIGNGDKELTGAVLYYSQIETGQQYCLSVSKKTDDGLLFAIPFEKEEEKGTYQLDKITYYMGLQRYAKSFQKLGMDIKWGVETKVTTQPDAVVEDDTSDSDIEYDISTLNEDGELVEQQTVEAALQDAEQQQGISAIRKYASTGTLTIVLDPGHDNTHAGARRNGLNEETLNYKIAQACKEELESYAGITVYMTRNSEECPYPGTTSTEDNRNRVSFAASVGADAYVSIHLNVSESSSASGTEVYYPNSNYNSAVGEEGKGLASAVLSSLTKLGLADRGIKIRNSGDHTTYPDGSLSDYYGVIRNSKLQGFPGIIIEHAFLSNAGDVANYLNNDAGLRKLGIADADGIANYYGLVKGRYEGIFDADFYYNQYTDLQQAIGYNRSALLRHFLENGLSEGRVASPAFDIKYYMEKYPDLRNAYGNDYWSYCTHFMNAGMNEGRQGCRTFNVTSYRNLYADLRNAYGNNRKEYYLHFVNRGYAEGRLGTGYENRLMNPTTVYQGVDYSAVYNFSYYISHYLDLKNAFQYDDAAAIQHFVCCGMNEGRQASAYFDVHSYKNLYADLRAAYGNNLRLYYLHYISNGVREGRVGVGYANQIVGAATIYHNQDYSLVYDYNYYMKRYPDLKAAFGDDENAALNHFVTCGMSEGRQGKANFNVYSYKNRYSDLRRSMGSNLKAYYMHYISNGYKEGRSATGSENFLVDPITVYKGTDYSAVYDYQYYVRKYPDIMQAFGYNDAAVLEHFVTCGMNEGRQGSAEFNVTTYKERYPDLQAAFGEQRKSYYMHYLTNGRAEGRTGK